jgi:hypothetical protein
VFARVHSDCFVIDSIADCLAQAKRVESTTYSARLLALTVQCVVNQNNRASNLGALNLL